MNTQEIVEAAVLDFVQRHTDDDAPELDTFCSEHDPASRAEIRARILRFLAFDELVGSTVVDDDIVDGDVESSGAGAALDGRRTLGDFEILDELGAGGMGIVYRAIQRPLGREVALKVLSRGLGFSARYIERFRREAAAAARLEHPGIVRVFASGECDGVSYFAMELVHGRSLHEVLDDIRAAQDGTSIHGSLGVLPDGAGYPAEVAELTAQIADALAAAHAANVVHRDVKTRNVMLDANGCARVLDFGLAKDQTAEDLSWTGEVSGTPHAMSPEQTGLRSEPVDHRTDIFALGVILYELLTLRRPFEADDGDVRELLARIASEEPPAIRKLRPQTPRDLCTICEKALEKDPTRRYSNAAEFAADLRRFLRFEPIRARPASVGTRVARALRRHRGKSLIAAVALVSLATWTAWSAVDQARRRGLVNDAFASARAAQESGDPVAAANAAFMALEAMPDDADVRARVDGFRLAATERNRLLAEAATARETDPELALLLALEATQYGVDHVVRSSVLDSLARHYSHRDLRGHRGPIAIVGFAPRGHLVATASHDHSVRLWDALRSDAEHRTLSGHRHWVRALAFSGDGTRLVTGSVDRHARIWDLATGTELLSLPHPIEVRVLCVDATGEVVTTADRHGVIRIWDTGNPDRGPRELRGHERAVTSMVRHRDGQQLLSASGDGSLRLWDTATGAALATLQFESWLRTVAVAADGTACAVASRDGRVLLCNIVADDPARGRLELANTWLHADQVQDVEFSPDGMTVASCSWDDTIRIWDRHSGREARILGGHDGDVHDIEFDRDGRVLVSASEDHTVRLWDTATGAELARMQHPDPVYSVHLSPDGTQALAHFGQTGIRLWDVGVTQRPVHALHGHRDRVRAVAFDAVGARLATASNDRTVRVFDTRRGQLVTEHSFDSPLHAIEFDPTQDALLVARESGVELIDVQSGATIRRFQGHEAAVRAARFDAGGQFVVTGCEDGFARIYRSSDGVLVKAIQSVSQVRGVALDAAGRRLAIVEAEREVARVFDAATGDSLLEIGRHDEPLTALDISPNGSRIVTASRDGTAQVSTLDDGMPLCTLSGHRAAIRAVRFVDANTILTGSSDGTARLWHASTGRQLAVWSGHSDKVYAVAASPDGRRVATGSADRTAQIWPVAPLEVAGALPLRPLLHTERERLDLLREVDRDAMRITTDRFEQLVLVDEVVAALRGDQSLDGATRDAAIAIAAARADLAPEALRARAARLTMHDGNPEQAARGLRLAEAACRLEPNNGYHHGVAGAALYRLDRFAEAYDRLTRARELLRRARKTEHGGYLAFLGMCEQRLGNGDAARTSMKRFRELLRDEPDLARKGRWLNLLTEFETLSNPEKPDEH